MLISRETSLGQQLRPDDKSCTRAPPICSLWMMIWRPVRQGRMRIVTYTYYSQARRRKIEFHMRFFVRNYLKLEFIVSYFIHVSLQSELGIVISIGIIIAFLHFSRIYKSYVDVVLV